jgi:hypothetical protein
MLGQSIQAAYSGVPPHEGGIMSDEIAKRILEHFRSGGTLDDGRIAALYRLANGLAPDTKTDPGIVGRWAFNSAVHLRLQAAGRDKTALPAIPPRTPRDSGR